MLDAGPGPSTLVGFRAMSTEKEKTGLVPTLHGSCNRSLLSHKPEAFEGVYIPMFKDEIEMVPTPQSSA